MAGLTHDGGVCGGVMVWPLAVLVLYVVPFKVLQCCCWGRGSPRDGVWILDLDVYLLIEAELCQSVVVAVVLLY